MKNLANYTFVLISITLSISFTSCEQVHIKKLKSNSLLGQQTSMIPANIKITATPAWNPLIDISRVECLNSLGINVIKDAKVQGSNPQFDGFKRVSSCVPPSRWFPCFDKGNEWALIPLNQGIEIVKCLIYMNTSEPGWGAIRGATFSILNSSNEELVSEVINDAIDVIEINFNKTRYVKLETANNNYLNINQIACFNKIGENVSNTKPVTASSIWDNFDPNRITNGSPDGTFFHTNITGNNWVLIDLQQNIEIEKCIIYNRKDCCQNRLVNGRLSLISGTNFTIKSSVIDQEKNIIEVNFYKSTRYIKLSAQNKNLGLNQIVCYNEKNENITNGKIVTASSTSSIASSTLTNGVLNGLNPFRTSNNGESWISIDLETNMEISKCIIYNRKDCCHEEIIGSKLSLQNSDKVDLESSTIISSDLVIELDLNRTRFIKYETVKGTYLNISQLACFNSLGDNITLRKPVTASSVLESTPSVLTDGVLETRASPISFATNQTGNNWVLIDLQSSHNIASCHIYNRKDCCKDRTIGSKITLLTHSKFEKQVHIINNSADVIDINMIKSRYIKLQADKGTDKYLQLSDIACFNSRGDNITKGKTVTASSIETGFDVNNIVNGRLLARNTNIYKSKNSENDWILIDLQSEQDIEFCSIYNTIDNSDRIYGAKLSLINSSRFEMLSIKIKSSETLIDVYFWNKKEKPDKLLAKYIYLDANFTEKPLQLTQIACFSGNSFENLCLKKFVIPSSRNSFASNESILTDGVYTSREFPNSFSTLGDHNDYLRLYLDNEYFITKIVFTARKDNYQNALVGNRVQLQDKNNNPIATRTITGSSASNFVVLINNYTKYVHLQMNNNGTDNYINISQIACYDEIGRNVALKKKVKVSTNFLNGFGTPDNLTRGRYDTSDINTGLFHSNQARGDNLLIDLDGEFLIRKCKIWNRSDCCKDRIVGAVISLLNAENGEIAQKTVTTGSDVIELDF